MIMNFFTDPHLGTRRAANTTRESSKKLQDTLYQAALNAIHPDTPNICLGDLFDRAFNDESVLVQGFNVATNCVGTLAGNHDETNRAGTVTSLTALKEMGVDIISTPCLSKPHFEVFGGHAGLYFVPHHASQELFEKAMFEASAHAAANREGKSAILALHCNYNCPFEMEDDTLNLSTEVAEQLLEYFDLILLGHEHKPSTHHDGRVIILGNTHPTSFSDISDKYRYGIDLDTCEVEQVKIWDQAASHLILKVGDTIPDLSGKQFVDVVGFDEAGNGPLVNQYVQEVWAAGADLLAVRNNVKLGDHLAGMEGAEAPKLVDLTSRIADDLKDSDLGDLYTELLKEVQA